MTAVRRVVVHRGRYVDSIGLLAIGAAMLDVPGVRRAVAAMGTVDGRERVVEAGWTVDELPEAGQVDLLVAAEADDETALDAAMAAAVDGLTRGATTPGGPVGEARARSVRQFRRRGGIAQVAIVAVPGEHAAAVAEQTLRAGMHTLIFSDNVSVRDEVRIKAVAAEHGVLAMGPDCGTAIIDGVPLGFANVVRRGPVAVVGASGTGMQEVTARLHRLGTGVSQVVGCGGRDLSDAVGAATMVRGIELAAADPDTRAIVLVSKPASAAVIATVVAACRPAIERGVVVIGAVVGAEPTVFAGSGIVPAPTLAAAADLAAAAVGAVPRTVADRRTFPRARPAARRSTGRSAAGRSRPRPRPSSPPPDSASAPS